MGAIPSSKLPGHRLLHERAIAALERCEEDQDIDFKQSAPWSELRYATTKTAMAMANLRGGGLVIVGVAEEGGTWHLTGIGADHRRTFDPDVIQGQLNAFASPPVAITAAIVEHDGESFLVIQVHEFEELPVICQRDGDKSLQAGTIFVRPLGVPRSARPTNATELRDILELAAEKQARRIIERGHRVGMRPSASARSRFDEELGGL